MNLIIENHEKVYEPSDDSYLLAENLLVEEGDFCLDVGTGSGILAIAMAKNNCKVLGIDVNPYAVELAKKNAKLNGVEHLTEFVQGDLFENVPGKFDFIVFNTPYLPTNDSGILAKAWNGGENFDAINRFLSQVNRHLKDNGKFEILLSSLTKPDTEKYKDKFEFKKIASKKLFFEEIYVLTGKLKR